MDYPNELQLADRYFDLRIPQHNVDLRIRTMIDEINSSMSGQTTDLLIILDGAFWFYNRLYPGFNFSNQSHFIRVKTYEGQVSNNVFNCDTSVLNALGKRVIIIEDIIDSGFTIHQLKSRILEKGIEELYIASLIYKPECDRYCTNPDFTGFSCDPEFLVGCGMDYQGMGRDLPQIYTCRKV
jgi:hypoxanthine phosphoribosyltransferase